MIGKFALATALLLSTAVVAAPAPAAPPLHIIQFQSAEGWGPDGKTDIFTTGDGKLSVRLLFSPANGGDWADTAVPSKMMAAEAHVCNRTTTPMSFRFEISSNPKAPPARALSLAANQCRDTETAYVGAGVNPAIRPRSPRRS